MSRRIKLTNEGYRFRCRRSPCKNHVRVYAAYSDAESYQSRHDVATHTRRVQAPERRFREAGAAWLVSMAPHWREKTHHWYTQSVEALSTHFGRLPLDRIENRDIMEWVQERRGSGKNATVRHLQTLRRVQKWAGVIPTWEIPRHEIRPRKKRKKAKGIERVRAILEAMPPQSLERDFATLKWLTLCRDVELREELRVGSWGDGVLRIRNRDKGGAGEVKCIPLVNTATEILARRSATSESGLIFELNGRPLLDGSTLVKRWRAAGAGNGISWIRHEAVTIARRMLEAEMLLRAQAVEDVSNAMDHAESKTTLRFYLLSDDEREIEEKRKIFRLLESLLPPSDEGADPPPDPLRQRIREYVQTQKGRAVSSSEISAALGVDLNVVYQMVYQMRRDGQITRVTQGRYRL